MVSARGFSVKGHGKLDLFVNLTLSGSGSWKSKVQTEAVRTSSDNCTWDQRCEFALNDLESVLTAAVNYKSVLGTTECIGVVEFPLQSILSKTMPNWYRLHRKGKQADEQKYRGELMLKFEFSQATHKLSTASSISMNSIQGSGSHTLDALKRKMRFGRKKSTISNCSSMTSLSQYDEHRASLYEACPQLEVTNESVGELENGLITPPARNGNSLTPPDLKPSKLSGFEGLLRKSFSRHTSASSRNSSPVHTPDERGVFDAVATLPRSRSAASSGFGSARSTLLSGPEMTPVSRHASRDELVKNINDLRLEMARKDAKICDLQEYIGRLLERILERDPGILEAVAAAR